MTVASEWHLFQIKDLSMMCHALWDCRQDGAMMISQCMKHITSSTLTYLSGPWVHCRKYMHAFVGHVHANAFVMS